MKIEKINENQIRCTLTSSDLESRKIRLSELAYGSEKAKRLFQDMMQQARSSFGFESDNSPLMIEAIPVSHDSIVLIITKVDDPEELDTRFSKFSSPDPDASEIPEKHHTGADDVLDLFRKIAEAKAAAKEARDEQKNAGTNEPEKQETQPEEITASVDLVQAYRFDSLEQVSRAARSLHNSYAGTNTLVKDRADNSYCLLLHADNTEPEMFNKICNILTEFGNSCAMTPGAEAHLLEHGDVLTAGSALQTLAAF